MHSIMYQMHYDSIDCGANMVNLEDQSIGNLHDVIPRSSQHSYDLSILGS